MTNEFQSFIEYLRTQGVASFNISFHAQPAPAKQADAPAFTASTTCTTTEELDVLRDPMLWRNAKIGVKPEPTAKETAVAPSRAVEPPVKPVETAKPTPQPPEQALPKDLYEAFETATSKDDGSEAAKARKLALIDAMGLDDLLRINNDYLLGIDQDQPADKFKSEIKECFA